MHKIDIETYEIEVKLPTGEITKLPYEMKEMLVGILLEDEEYKKLLSAVNTIKGFGMNDSEMVKRVIEAEEVAVSESGG
jgi:hypothetical protein